MVVVVVVVVVAAAVVVGCQNLTTKISVGREEK
jgi:hypothetical protein